LPHLVLLGLMMVLLQLLLQLLQLLLLLLLMYPQRATLRPDTERRCKAALGVPSYSRSWS
jgi:hypothetical protein